MAHHGHKEHHHRKHGGHMAHHAHGGHMAHHRKRGGKVDGEMEPKAMKPENTDEQEEEFLKDSETPERKHGGKMPHHHARKHGGHVPGKHAAHRPDRKHRAAGGGATSNEHPFSSAGKMSVMPYEKKEAANRVEGTGPDRD